MLEYIRENKECIFNKTYSCISQPNFVQRIFILENVTTDVSQTIEISKSIKKSLQQNAPMVFESYLYHLEILEDIEINE